MADQTNTAEPTTQSEPEKVVEEPNLAQVLARLNAQDEKLKGLERVNSRKESENQKLREQLENRESDQSLSKALLGVLAGQRGQPVDELEAEVRTNQPDLVKQFETLTAKQTQDRRNERIREYQEKAIEVGIKEDDPEYGQLFYYVTTGKWSKADTVLSKIEELKKPKDTTSVIATKPNPQEVEEAARRMLEERGQLKTEPTKPSSIGAKFTIAQVKAMSWKEQTKNFPGGVTEIMDKLNKGEISP